MSTIVTKTQEEIDKEIAALKELKPQVRQRNFFGEDNHDAIDAQIDVLENNLDEDDVYNTYDGNQHVVDNALMAVQWREGEADDFESMSAEWRTLAQ